MDFGKIAKDVMGILPKAGPEESREILPESDDAPSLAALPVASDVEATLDQRGRRYGKFTDNNEIFAQFMEMVNNSPVALDGRMGPAHLHALSNIGTKIARLLTGDPNYDDNWRDIAGYATLMVAICNGEER